MPEPVAVAFDVDELAVVKQPVEDGGCDYGTASPKSSCQSVKLLLEVMMTAGRL